MFVRKVQNRSGSVSVQIISKSHGRYQVIQSLGSSKDPKEIEYLISSAQEIINNPKGQSKLSSDKSTNSVAIESFVKKISNSQIHTIGPELIFGRLFNLIGFDVIKEDLFRHIVIARLAYPTSKLKTVDYLRRYKGIDIDKHALYRFLDKIHSRYKDIVEGVVYKHTQKILQTISIVFYDMTTLYFEAEDEDDLRKIGFSKDGKFQHPQIMIGLLVGQGGRPIGYDIFKGNTFEGHTLLPILKKIQEKYGFENPVVVADAALLSKDNLENLSLAQYKFILGGRVKNENDEIKKEILKWADGLEDGNNFEIAKADGTRLLVTYSSSRAKKDAHNREKGISKLRAQVSSGKLTKRHVNNRGYNKFLVLEGEVGVSLDEDKIREDAKWDGLKGYITNTDLTPDKIVENYRDLWQIEYAFRISKTDLRIRPIYHYKKQRIESHICIAFVAYAIYKELEHILKVAGVSMSPKRAAELTHNMYELEYSLQEEHFTQTAILKMDSEQQILFDTIANSVPKR